MIYICLLVSQNGSGWGTKCIWPKTSAQLAELEGMVAKYYSMGIPAKLITIDGLANFRGCNSEERMA